ncbi:MAG: ATP-dependent Clp protease proteolytic subunit [Ignavibacteria bacterium]|nr:ATP-dependent Clp protease proteolytic subunit [Ignavibacteria bacterium]
MEELFNLINELRIIRKIPQLLYYDAIYPSTSIAIKKKIIEYQEQNPNVEEIDFIINSPGGTAEDAYRIIKLLRAHFKMVNIVIPFWAKSAATLLSFGGSKIIMDELGEFGALDVQLRKEKEDSPDYERESALIDEISLKRIEDRAQDLFKLTFVDFFKSRHIPISKNILSEQLFDYIAKFYEPLLKQISPYKIGDKKRKLDIAVQYANRILSQFNTIDDRTRKLLIDFLVNECPDHSYIIDYPVISNYLPNVVTAESIGQEYSKALSKVCLYFMSIEREETYIGFIELKQEKVEPEEKKQIIKNSKIIKQNGKNGKNSQKYNRKE